MLLLLPGRHVFGHGVDGVLVQLVHLVSGQGLALANDAASLQENGLWSGVYDLQEASALLVRFDQPWSSRKMWLLLAEHFSHHMRLVSQARPSLHQPRGELRYGNSRIYCHWRAPILIQAYPSDLAIARVVA